MRLDAEAGDVQTALTDEERRAVGRKARQATLDALKALGGEARREDLEAWALARGGFTGRELDQPAPAKCKDGHASLVACRLSWAPTNLKREGLVENPRWGTWRLVGTQGPEPAVEQLISAARLRELRAMSYPGYLATPEWRATRAAALRRAGNRCQLDAAHPGPFDVHHNTYERLGVERAGDLVVLCGPCHRRHHAEPEPTALASVPAEPYVVPLAWSMAAERKPSLLRRFLGRA